MVLARGDALYVPRGVVHCCAAGPEGSTHLTLGVEVEPVLEWHALLQLLLLTASRAASAAAAAAAAPASARLHRSVALPGEVSGEARPPRARKRRLAEPAAAAAAAAAAARPCARWLELVQMALLLG